MIFNFARLIVFVFLGLLNIVNAADVVQPLDDVQGYTASSLAVEALGTEMIGDACIDPAMLITMEKSVTPADYILVAEDNVLNRRILIRGLNNAGYTNLIVAEDGRQAVTFFAEGKQAGKSTPLAFMDINMPNMDGDEAATAIRKYLEANYPEDRIFIWAVTAQEHELPAEVICVFNRVRYEKLAKVSSIKRTISVSNAEMYAPLLAQN